MVGVTWDGPAKPCSRHLKTLEAKVKGRKPKGGVPQSPGVRLGAVGRIIFPSVKPPPRPSVSSQQGGAPGLQAGGRSLSHGAIR